jgi:hypothetical protein
MGPFSGVGIQLCKIGRRRRVRFMFRILLKKRREIQSQEAMEALVRQAQELGMGYDLKEYRR